MASAYSPVDSLNNRRTSRTPAAEQQRDSPITLRHLSTADSPTTTKLTVKQQLDHRVPGHTASMMWQQPKPAHRRASGRLNRAQAPATPRQRPGAIARATLYDNDSNRGVGFPADVGAAGSPAGALASPHSTLKGLSIDTASPTHGRLDSPASGRAGVSSRRGSAAAPSWNLSPQMSPRLSSVYGVEERNANAGTQSPRKSPVVSPTSRLKPNQVRNFLSPRIPNFFNSDLRPEKDPQQWWELLQLRRSGDETVFYDPEQSLPATVTAKFTEACLASNISDVQLHYCASAFKRSLDPQTGWNQLQRAAKDNNAQLVSVLLELGASANVQDSGGRTAVHLAVGTDSRVSLRVLLKEGGQKVHVDAHDSQGRTALHYAASLGRLECARALLDAWANVSCRDNQGRTPLLAACASGNTKVARLLVHEGARLDDFDNDGETCISLAAQTENLAHVRWIASASDFAPGSLNTPPQ